MHNLKGKVFNRLTVVDKFGSKNKRLFWNCICVCGNKTKVATYDLLHNKIKSCGCLGRETRSKNGKANFKHGKCKTSEYGSWTAMIRRCENINDQAYNHYGGRGITVCDRWRNSFLDFYKDMGSKPFNKAQIDRKDNNGNYEPGNCWWTTSLINNNNRNNTLMIKHNGEMCSVADLAREFNLNYQTLLYRFQNGVHIDEALCRRPHTGIPYKNQQNIRYAKSKKKLDNTNRLK